MIDKVVFDLGNVLLRFDFSRTYRGLEAHGARFEGIDEAALVELKNAYETGAISSEEMFTRTSSLTGYGGSREHFERSWQDIFQENEPMIAVLGKLRERGVPCFLLSNSNDLHVRFIRERYQVLQGFSDIIFSHEVRAMKPDEVIFRQAIERFELQPERTLYIDDLAPNIETGRRLGFRCIHYDLEAHEAAENEMERLGLNFLA